MTDRIPEIEPGIHGTQSVMSLTGATYRQLNYWINKGYINRLPIVGGHQARGSGIRDLFDEHEVRVAWLLNHLVELGMSPAGAATIARDLADMGESAVGALTIHLESA